MAQPRAPLETPPFIIFSLLMTFNMLFYGLQRKPKDDLCITSTFNGPEPCKTLDLDPSILVSHFQWENNGHVTIQTPARFQRDKDYNLQSLTGVSVRSEGQNINFCQTITTTDPKLTHTETQKCYKLSKKDYRFNKEHSLSRQNMFSEVNGKEQQRRAREEAKRTQKIPYVGPRR